MTPEDLRSGRRWRSPSRSSQAIFSQVTITSPKAASTTGFPESSAATLAAHTSGPAEWKSPPPQWFPSHINYACTCRCTA